MSYVDEDGFGFVTVPDAGQAVMRLSDFFNREEPDEYDEFVESQLAATPPPLERPARRFDSPSLDEEYYNGLLLQAQKDRAKRAAARKKAREDLLEAAEKKKERDRMVGILRDVFGGKIDSEDPIGHVQMTEEEMEGLPPFDGGNNEDDNEAIDEDDYTIKDMMDSAKSAAEHAFEYAKSMKRKGLPVELPIVPALFPEVPFQKGWPNTFCL